MKNIVLFFNINYNILEENGYEKNFKNSFAFFITLNIF